MNPTIGRVVHVHGKELPGMNKLDGQPVAGIVCAVHGPDCVSVGGFDHLATPFSAREIPFVQEGDGAPVGATYAVWPPIEEKRAKVVAGASAPGPTGAGGEPYAPPQVESLPTG